MLTELEKRLVEALENAREVMEFAYMNAVTQPKEIKQARTVLNAAREKEASKP